MSIAPNVTKNGSKPLAVYGQKMLRKDIPTVSNMWQDSGTVGSSAEIRISQTSEVSDKEFAKETKAKRLSKRNKPPRRSIYRTM